MLWDRVGSIYLQHLGGRPAMFLFGSHRHSIDAKNRVSIPARFRELLIAEKVESLVAFIGFDPCIWIYPQKEAEAFMSNFDGPEWEEDDMAASFKRKVTTMATPTSVDAQGRVMISDEQRQHAGLGKDVVILGNGQRIEIWDPTRLEADLGKVPEGKLRELAKKHFNSRKV